MSNSHPLDNMEGLLPDLGEIPDPSTAKPQSVRRSSNPLQQQRQQHQPRQLQQPHQHQQRQRQRQRQQQQQQRQQHQPRQLQQPHQHQQRQRQRQRQQQQQQQHLPAASRLETDPLQITPSSQNPKAILQQRAPKVAIPRLQRGPEIAPTVVSPLADDKARVSHACEPCRHRKTKCSGDRPSCKHCEDFKIACFYADRKREKSRKEFRAMAKRLEEYEKLLRDLILRVDDKDQRLIRKALEHELASEDDETLSQASSRTTTASASKMAGAAGRRKGSQVDRAIEEEVGDGMSSKDGDGRPSLARVGSTRSLGHINEDFNRTAATRATGFMGKNSELAWMQRLKREADVGPGFGEEDMPMLNVASSQENLQHPISESTYHCDDLSMLVLDHVEPYEVPSRPTADRLFEHYLDTVHPSFPIIGKTTFLDQYRTYLSTNLQAGANWLAILNLIFAIGAKYSRLIRADWGGKEGDDVIYFTRARLLGFNTDSILDHAGLQSVQVAGLIAFYLSAIDQISRAWTFSGIAMRHALSLGLNLQNNSDSISDSSKEIRRRVWWAVCSVDIRLAVMTGRPSAFLSANSTVPLPFPVEEESFFLPGTFAFPSGEGPLHPRYAGQESPYRDDASPNPPSSASTQVNPSPTESLGPQFSQTPVPASNALYFLLQTKLSLITNEVLDQLYRPRVVTRSWAHVQLIISALTGKLEQWRRGLPSVFDFSRRQRDLQFRRQRICLGLFYYSTAMIISRPCLCRMNRTMRHPSEKSKEFERATAAKCVHAAKDMLDLLPNEPEPAVLYKVAPWWCLVHHLVQASTISMLELSFQADHVPEEVENLLQTAKKAARWLRSMAEVDLAASRAWRLCEEMLHKVASIVGKPFGSYPDGTPFDGVDGVDGGEPTSPDHPFHTPLTRQDGGANMRERSDLMHPSEGPNQQLPFVGEWPFQAQIYTPYDEVFPPSFHPSVMMAAAESSSDFLSMYPSPGQMEGLLSGDLDDFSMTRDDDGGP